MNQAKVFIVDDHSVVRMGIAQIIGKEEDMTVCGESETLQQALAEIPNSEPDIVLVDISLSRDSGLDLIQHLSSNSPAIPVLAVSMHDELVYIQSALQAGAKGYFHKHDQVCNIPVALRKILSGQSYFSEDIAAKMAEFISNQGSSTPQTNHLSHREKEILDLLGTGYRRQQIAEKLFISVKTVSAHIENLKTKLGLSSTDEVFQYAVRQATKVNSLK